MVTIAEGGELADIEAIGIYSDELDMAKELNEQFGVKIMENYYDLCPLPQKV